MAEKNCVYLLNTLAAKFDGKESWLPFPKHLADTAGVMEWLTTHWLPDHVTVTIMEKNPQIELNKLCKFIALVHDIGKVTPVFQSKICEGSGYLKERIAALGIDVPPFSSFISRSKTPHSFAGEAILLRAGCPKGIAAVVGAHHGEPYTDTEADEEDLIEYYEENFYGIKGMSDEQGQKWEMMRKQWIDMSLSYCGYHSIYELPEIDVPSQMLISGLLMMADWIASNTEYAPLISLDETGGTELYPQRTEQILKKLNFPDQWMPCCWFMDDDIFRQKYGFSPNEMQRQVIKAAEGASEPGIYIIEAQMGQGKTEAALSAAEIFASKWHCGNVIKLRNIEKSQIEKYGIFLLKSVDNSHDLCGRFYQILRSGR